MKKLGEKEVPHVAHESASGRLLFGTVIALQLALLLAALDQTVVSTAVPRIVAELNGFSLYAWITTAYLTTSTIAVPISGKLSDLYGRKRIFLCGVGLFVIASLLCGSAGTGLYRLAPVGILSDGMTQLIVFRALQGLAGGIIMALTFTIIGDIFSPADRGKYQGVFAAVFVLAALCGPALGGWIVDHTSWRWVFYINVPIGIVSMLVFQLAFRQPQRLGLDKRPIDLIGMLIFTAMLVPFLLAMTFGNDYGWHSMPVSSSLLFCSALVFFLIYHERRHPEPVIPMSLFSNSVIVLSSISLFVSGIGLFGSILLLPLFMQSVLQFTAAKSGLFLTPLMLVVGIASILSGHILSKSRRYKPVTLIGWTVMCLGTWFLSTISSTTPVPVILTYMIVVGFGLGLILPVYTIIIQNVAPRELLGAATALSQFFRSVGGTIGTSVFGAIMLSVYREHLSRLVAPSTPRTILKLLSNPLNPLQLKSELSSAIGNSPADLQLSNHLSHCVSNSLVVAIDKVFMIYAIALTLTLTLNGFLRDIELKSQIDADH